MTTTFAQRASTTEADDFELPAGYRTRPAPDRRDDPARDDGVVWQPDVYAAAAEIARALDCDTLVDLGCGRADKLLALAGEFKPVGVDRAEAIAHGRRRFPEGTWLEADFERASMLPLKPALLQRSVLVCADVLEELADPRALLALLGRLLRTAPALVLSTPDRVCTWGAAHRGPPPNPAHAREWTRDEFTRLLRREGFTLVSDGHTRSCDARPDRSTVLVVAVNPVHPAVAGSLAVQAALDAAPTPEAAPSTPPTPSTPTRSEGPRAFREPSRTPPEPSLAGHRTGAATAMVPSTAPSPAQDSADRQCAAARAALVREDADGFERAMSAALALDPQHRDTLVLLGRLQLDRGAAPAAARLFADLLGRHPDDDEVLEGAVVARLRCGDRAGARRVLTAAVGG